jgi:myosin-light-chain kinase
MIQPTIYFSLAPLTLKQSPSDVNVLQSQNAQITFEVDGLPRPNITWLFNGNPIQSSAKHKIETKGNQFILNVNKTDFADSGTYTAIIDNGIEKIEVPVKMNVGGNEQLYLSFNRNTYIFTISS